MNEIARRIENVRERISAASERSGRNLEEITLIAVTKTVDPARIQEAYAAGIRDFGENYYQEARDKLALFGNDVRWHFIGHLQSNKAKYVPGAFHLLQTLDSVTLARELDRRALQKEILQKVLIEVKLDASTTKNGIQPAEIPALIGSLADLQNLRLLGLMGIPPVGEGPESARPYFARLKEVFDMLPAANREVLSMGMTADFETAIEEGSTMVRIGSAFFGPRDR